MTFYRSLYHFYWGSKDVFFESKRKSWKKKEKLNLVEDICSFPPASPWNEGKLYSYMNSFYLDGHKMLQRVFQFYGLLKKWRNQRITAQNEGKLYSHLIWFKISLVASFSSCCLLLSSLRYSSKLKSSSISSSISCSSPPASPWNFLESILEHF